MNMTIVLGLGALFFYGFNDVIFKRAAQGGTPAHHLLLIQNVVILPIFVAYGLATGSLVPSYAGLFAGIGIGIVSFTGFYNFARSMTSGAVSVVAPIFRLNFVLTSILAVIALGEAFSIMKVGVLALAVAAVWLLLASGQAKGIEMNRNTIIHLGLAIGSISIGHCLYKLAFIGGASTSSVLIVVITTLAIISPVVTRWMDGKISVPASSTRLCALGAVFQAIAVICLAEGYARGEASMVAPISQLGFVVSAILGVVLFREALTSRKVVGLTMAIGAVALFTIASQ